MNKRLLLALLLIAAGAFAKDGFKPLFNGKNLDGWDGDPRLWSVRDGMIVGSTEGNPLKYNSFLATRKSYANFILRAQAKLRNHDLRSALIGFDREVVLQLGRPHMIAHHVANNLSPFRHLHHCSPS